MRKAVVIQLLLLVMGAFLLGLTVGLSWKRDDTTATRVLGGSAIALCVAAGLVPQPKKNSP